jgi:hypothetical protein
VQRLHPSYEDSWSNEFYLLFKPWKTGGDFSSARFLMEPALTLRDPLEVFHDIRNVCLSSVDSGFSEGFFQDSAGRTHKRRSLQIFLMTGLLSHYHYR